MEIKRDSRQVPSIEKICASKQYNDILYAYLQVIAEKVVDEEGRILRLLSKKKVKFVKLAEKLGLTRQTVSKKFKNLYDLDLIVEFDDEYYQIVELTRDKATLVPYHTLKTMVDTLNDNCVSIYVCLLNWYYMNGCKPFKFTLDQLKTFVGLSTGTRNNNDIITNILFVLQKLGLIKYSMGAVSQEEFNHIKTIYQIDEIFNEIK